MLIQIDAKKVELMERAISEIRLVAASQTPEQALLHLEYAILYCQAVELRQDGIEAILMGFAKEEVSG